MVRPHYYACLLFILLSGGLFAQQGVHGPRTVTAANTILNEYTAITAAIPAGSTNITVANSGLNTNGRFTGNLQAGDMVMLYTVQGVYIHNQFTVAGPTDTMWGRIPTQGDYFDCGRYEFRQVLSVPNATTITLDCGTTYAYSNANGNASQVIRVPRLTTLTINVGGVLTCDDWNGTVGGVVIVEVQGNTVVNGQIDATGKGFRGGSLVGDNVTSFGVNTAWSTNNTLGAEKGESVVGYQALYDSPFGGRYCRAAAANGGGGGDAHNAGGGGGANGPNSTSASAVWSGNGIPDPAYAAAWNLEPPANTMTLRTAANSAGGGRGGYSFSSNNQNANSVAPGNGTWGGDARNHEATGLGGRPLDYTTGRLFFGGGGGAGDQNELGGGAGGDGGGLIYIMGFGTVSGSGTITSNGNNGAPASGGSGTVTGIDGAGGAGGGGTIVVNAIGGCANTLSIVANGGVGGNQAIVRPLFNTSQEAEGPGGGGGGGYIAVSSGAPARTSNGGNNGTTNSAGLTEFPPNGATRGCPGTNNATITNFDFSVTNQTVCSGTNVSIPVTMTGTPPPGFTIVWYNVAVGGSPIANGTPYVPGVLPVGTYTYYVGTCSGWWREPVTITVVTPPAAPVLSSNSPICSGSTLNLFSNTVAGATYTWTGPNSFSSALEDPTIPAATTAATGTYSLTISIGGCNSPQSTISVTVNPTPAAPVVGSNSPLCAGQALNLTANTIAGATYTWTGPNSFSSSLEDPTIPAATTAATGTYSLTVTVGGCVSAQSTVSVIVNTTPAAPVLSSNTPVCSGNALNLFSNTVAGGTYTWTGPNTFSSALEDPTIAAATTAATGTYSLTISVGGCTSPQSTTAVVVNPTPAAPVVGSNSPLCSGQTLNLTANTIAGATYTWTGPNSFSSSLEDPSIPLVTTAATGTYSLTVTVGGCTSAQSTVAVTVSNTPAAPVLSSNTPVCSGNALNLFSNTVAGGTYTWTGPNTFSSALEDPTIAAATTAATGTYSLTISVGGCTSPQSTTAVVVNPTPAAPVVGSNSPLCSGQTLNLTANTIAGATYTWTGPNSFSSSLEDPTIPAATTAATGTYSLTVTVGGCTSPQSTVSVIVGNTPSAPVLSSNTPVCSGNALNLFSNTVAGGTYTWTGPNSFSSALEDPTIAAATTAATGTYSLTISIGGCTSPQSTTAVVVNPTPAAPVVGSNSPLCSGQTLNLTANTIAGATYTWTGPNSFSSSLEDPAIAAATTAATGTYSLTVTVGGCTSAQSTVSVIVGNTPSAPVLSSNTPVCSGNILTLFSNTVVGGTYTWTGPNSFSSALEDPTIAGVTTAATGTYSLTISIGGCTSPQSITAVVVNPTPSAPVVGSNSPICSGQALNLTANTIAGATYTWTGPNSFSSSLEDPTIPSATTAETGTYSLTVTVGGCTSAQSTVSVVVNPTPGAPTLSSNTPLCEGTLLTLFSNTVAGGTYTWTGPNSFSSALEDPTIAGVTLAAAGTYSLTVSVGACVSPQSTTVVVVNPVPAAPVVGSNSPLCDGQTLNLTANTVASGTYSWTGPNSFTSALEDPSIVGATTAATGTYSLTITDNGCTSPQSTVAVVVNALPTVTAGSDIAICAGDSTPLSGTGTGTMVWSNAAGLSCTNCSAPVAGPSATTTYTLTLTDVNGCVNTDDVIVTVNTLPVATAGSDVAYCNGDSTTLNGGGGGTYSWLPVTDLSNASVATPVASPTATITYTLLVTDGNGCQDTDAVVVTVHALPIVMAGADQTMCPAGNVPLNGLGAQTYVWSPGTGLTCTACQNPVATPAVTTPYYLVGTDSNGCVNYDTVIVTVAPNLVITASADQTICVGDSAGITTSGSGTFVWSPGATLSNANVQSPVAGPSATTTYTINVTDSSGCTGSDSVTVFVNQPVVTTASGATTICIGQSATLSASSTGGDGNYTYTWNPGPATGSPVTVSPVTTTVYTLDVIDGVGCTDQQSVTVTVNSALTLNTISPDSACVGGSVSLTAAGSGGDNNLVYTWYPGPLTGASQTVAVNSTVTYTVVLTDGCTTPSDTQYVTVVANQSPVVSLSSVPSSGCGPLSSDFTGTSSGTCTSELWSFGDNTTSVSNNPTHVYTTPGTYDVIYSCTDANGCVGTDTSLGMITVFANPVASFFATPSGTIQLTGGSAQICFTDQSTGATSWSWQMNEPTGTQSSTLQNPCFTVSDTGAYSIWLTTQNASGCVDYDSLVFHVDYPCHELFVPSAFSPNGDGMNDTFFVYGTCVAFMQLEIYSRWGEQVFISTTPTNGWDGTWRGKQCESAVFTYVLRGQMDDGTPIEKQGNITLTR